MNPITVVILTLNEERHLPECIAAARQVSPNVVVLDSGSTDGTVTIARSLGARVHTRPFDTYPNQRNAALALVDTPWALFVDADERVTPALATEIKAAIRHDAYAGWWIPRRNIIVGRWIRGGGWYPDYQLRLMRPDRERYDPAQEVHEIVVLEGKAGYLEAPLVHYNYDTWGQFRAKQRRYAPLEARALARKGVSPRAYTYITMPVREFWRRFVLLRGYRDGLHGVRLAVYMAWYTALVYWQLRTLRRRQDQREHTE